MISSIRNKWLRRSIVVMIVPFALAIMLFVAILDAVRNAIVAVVDTIREWRYWWTCRYGGREDIADAWRGQ